MINLLSGGAFTEAINRGFNPVYFGLLTSPSSRNSPQHAIERGLPWACDNDCFLTYNPMSIYNMLKKYQGLKGCVFMNAPDVVMNHKATLKRFVIWERLIHGLGFPVAFTLQNGCTVRDVPWNKCEALFIGGDTQFKYTKEVREIVKEANRRKMWIHNGRVNTPERVIYSRNIGCSSFDGTGYSIYPPKIKQIWQIHTGDYQPFLLDA
jgi:hypothetical protein